MPPIPSSLSSTKPAFPEVSGEHWVDALKDTSHVLIRPLRAEDRDREKAFIQRLSPESRHYRFLCEIKEPGEVMLDQLMTVDHKQHMAYVALAYANGELVEVGISRYAAADLAHQCECAVTVADEWQRRGLGTLLLNHLIKAARDNGYTQMYSVDSAANLPMRALAQAFGFTTERDPDDASQVIHCLSLVE
jgi:GNAT superfamily N-acetyltransferase